MSVSVLSVSTCVPLPVQYHLSSNVFLFKMSEPTSNISKDDIYQQFHNYDFHGNARFEKGWSKVQGVLQTARYDEELLKAKLFFYSKEVEPVTLNGYRNWLKQSNMDIQETCRGRTQKENNQSTEHRVTEQKGDNSSLASVQQESDAMKRNTDDGGTKDTQKVLENEKSVISNTNKMNNVDISDTEASGSGDQVEDATESKNLAEQENSNITCPNRTNNETDGETVNIPNISGNDSSSIQSTSDKEVPLSLSEVADMIQKGLKLPGIEELNIKPTNEHPTSSTVERKKKPWEE